MIERKTILDQVEVTSNNILCVRMGLLLVEDDKTLSSKYHRASISLQEDCRAVLEGVNSYLESEGIPPLPQDKIEYVVKMHDLVKLENI